MKKTLVLCFVLIFLFSTTLTAATNQEEKVPTKVKVISQSCMSEGLCLTVIDLENNEVVIMFYSIIASGLFKGQLKYHNMVRTGMFVEPDEQGNLIGQDAPFTEETSQGTGLNFNF